LESSWTDVTRREIQAGLEMSELDGVAIDNEGRYHAERMPQGLDDTIPFLEEAANCLAELEETEGSDCETLHNRQVGLLFQHAVLDVHAEKLLGSRVARSARTRNELVRANLRLARSVSSAWWHSTNGSFDDEDLFQEACLGLLRAAEKFDPRRGNKFSTYATWWIRQAASRALADKAETIRLPVHIVDRLRKLRRARRELEVVLGRQPTAEELQKNLGWTTEQLSDLTRAAAIRLIPLDDLTDSEELRVIASYTESLEEQVVGRLMQADIERVLAGLDARSRDVLYFRLGLDGSRPMTLEAIGIQLGVTRERVRQIESDALERVAKGVIEPAA
jgi:RNA polymerase primary sigma factor